MKHDGLTDRQLEVAVLVADGLTDTQIAKALGIHEQSVRFHIWRIASKWNLDEQKNVRILIVKRITQQSE